MDLTLGREQGPSFDFVGDNRGPRETPRDFSMGMLRSVSIVADRHLIKPTAVATRRKRVSSSGIDNRCQPPMTLRGEQRPPAS